MQTQPRRLEDLSDNRTQCAGVLHAESQMGTGKKAVASSTHARQVDHVDRLHDLETGVVVVRDKGTCVTTGCGKSGTAHSHKEQRGKIVHFAKIRDQFDHTKGQGCALDVGVKACSGSGYRIGRTTEVGQGIHQRRPGEKSVPNGLASTLVNRLEKVTEVSSVRVLEVALKRELAADPSTAPLPPMERKFCLAAVSNAPEVAFGLFQAIMP